MNSMQLNGVTDFAIYATMTHGTLGYTAEVSRTAHDSLKKDLNSRK